MLPADDGNDPELIFGSVDTILKTSAESVHPAYHLEGFRSSICACSGVMVPSASPFSIN